MKYLLQRSRMQTLKFNRNGYLMLASISFVLNIMFMLDIYLLQGRERIILVPPAIEKTMWVTNSKVSPEYLSEMSLFLANLRLNVTASNASQQHELLLRYVAPKNYSAIKTELLTEVENLKKNHITTAFFPTDVEVDGKKTIARVTGHLQSTVGDTHLPFQKVAYQMTYQYQSGRLFVESIEEVKPHG
jgi:conjugal transfer pilus assembly protein TraE